MLEEEEEEEEEEEARDLLGEKRKDKRDVKDEGGRCEW